MKYVASFLVLASFVVLGVSDSVARALETEVTDSAVPSALETRQFIITAVPLVGAEFIELHDQTDQAVKLDGYALVYIFGAGKTSEEFVILLPHDVYVVANGYVTIGTNSNVYVDILYELLKEYYGKAPSAIEIEKDGKRLRQIENASSTATKYTWLKCKSDSSGMGVTQGHFTQKESPAELSGYGLWEWRFAVGNATKRLLGGLKSA